MAPETTGLVLQSPEGTRFLFDPGALCLEFLVTGGPGALARYESLHEPADLAAWAALSRLRLDPAAVRVVAGELRAARRLRDALWRLARARAGGHPAESPAGSSTESPTARPGGPPAPRPAGPGDWNADPADLNVLNDAAARVPLVPRVRADGTRGWASPVTGGQVVSAVARDAVELFTGPYARRVRECGAHDCYLVFVDTSRPGRRRWCAMERCGNRHKVRTLRARRDGA